MVSKVISAESKNRKNGKATTHRPVFKRNVANNNKTSSWKKHMENSNKSAGQPHVNPQTNAASEVLAMFQKPTSWKALKAQITLANVMTMNNTVKLDNVDVWQHVPQIYRPNSKQE